MRGRGEAPWGVTQELGGRAKAAVYGGGR